MNQDNSMTAAKNSRQHESVPGASWLSLSIKTDVDSASTAIASAMSGRADERLSEGEDGFMGMSSRWFVRYDQTGVKPRIGSAGPEIAVRA